MRLILICLMLLLPSSWVLADVGRVVLWIPYAPGGLNTRYALILQKQIESRSRYQVILNYVPGAGGRVGFERFAATQDGNINLLLGNDKIPIMVYLAKNLDPTALDRLQPLAFLGNNDYVISVNQRSPARSVADLDQLGKSSLTFGSVGKGSYGHFVQLYLQRHLRTSLTPVFYRGAAAGLAELAGGHIDLYFSFESDAMPFIETGRIVPVGTSRRGSSLTRDFASQRVVMPGGSFFALFSQNTLAPAQRQNLQELLRLMFDDPAVLEEWQRTIKTSRPHANANELARWWRSRLEFYQGLGSDPLFRQLEDSE